MTKNLTESRIWILSSDLADQTDLDFSQSEKMQSAKSVKSDDSFTAINSLIYNLFIKVVINSKAKNLIS